MTVEINAAQRLSAEVRPDDWAALFTLLHDMGDGEVTMAIVNALKDVRPKAITAMVLSGHLCPSQLGYCGPYPGFLAEILVKSSAEESLTDLSNAFYSRSRKLSPEALEVFQQKVLANPKKQLLKLSGAYPNGFDKMTKAMPDFVKKLLLALPKKDFAQLLESDPRWEGIVKSLKINA